MTDGRKTLLEFFNLCTFPGTSIPGVKSSCRI